MTRNELRVRDRFTFSLTGIPVVSSYASMPVISNDRIRKVPGKNSKGSKKAQCREANTPTLADAAQANCA